MIKILLIEDNPGDARLIREMFREVAEELRFELECADRLAPGLELLAADQVDLVLLDLGLPDSRGFDTLFRLSDRCPDVPIVVLTGLDDRALALECVQRGAQDYLVKGQIDSRLLSRVIRYSIERQRMREALKTRAYELNERLKKLRCLHSISELMEQPGSSLEKVLQGVVDLIPPACQYPDLTCARICVEGREFRTKNFTESTWRQARDIKIMGKSAGSVEVCYLEERPEATEGVFLTEEGQLLEVIRERIGRVMERLRTEEALSKSLRELQETAQRLEQSRNMLQLIIESIPLRVFWKDTDSRFMGCNTLFARDAGLNQPQQLLGKDDFAMGWKEQADLYRRDDRQVMESRRPKLNIVEPQTTPTGAKIWLNTSKVPLFMGNGEVIGILGIYEDITERKRVQAELKLKEQMLNDASDSIFLQDMDGNYIYVNEAAYISRGYEKEELLGKNVVDLVSPEMAQSRERLLKELLERGETIFTSEHLRRDGSAMPVEIHARLIDVDDRRLILSVVRDITQRKQAEEALREATEALQALIQASPLAIFVLDPEGRVQLWNEASQRIFGWTAEEAMGQVLPIVPEDKMPEFRGLLQRALDGKPILGLELRRQKKDGSPIDVRAYTTTLYDPQGRVTGIMALIADNTLEKRAEEALRASEERYRMVADYTYDMEYWLDPEGTILYISPACERLTGYPPQAFQKNPQLLLEILHPEDQARFDNHVKEVRSHQEPSSLDFRLLHRHGQEFWVNHSCRPVFGAEGQPLGWRASNRDITERKLAEEAFQSLVTHAPMGIYIVQEGKFAMINPGIEAITGYHAPELLGQDCLKPVSPEYRAFVREQAIQRLKGEALPPYEYQYITKSGERGWVMETVTPTQFRGKSAVLGYFMDITRLKQVEAQFIQAQKMEAMGTLAGGIAHDFNNILGVMLGYTEMALFEVSENSPLEHKLQQVLKAGQRAKGLVGQILAFSRPSIKKREAVRISSVIKEALDMLRATLPATIDIRQNIIAEEDTVLADATEIHQVLINLCANAAHAMREEGGVLEVSLTSVSSDDMEVAIKNQLTPGPYIKLSVSDTGHGMDREAMNRIFEPFFTTKKPGEGTGMGLAVVHGIIKGHGGAVQVNSRPGYGSVFEVYLPVTEKYVSSKITKQLPLTGKGERILLVDDEEGMVEMWQEVLRGLGYEVTGKTSSLEALALFRNQPDYFNLVITDQTMIHMTGINLAKKLLQIRPTIPIILCSGFSETITPEQAKAIGVREYLMKPLSIQDLNLAIQRVLYGGGTGLHG